MELRHMRYFVAVAEHLHFGKAAEALATAQPSLSRQIQQLEDELGVQLFDRSNHRVELTDAGRLFLIDARRTLQSAEASLRHARENADGTRGELRIGFIGGAMLMLLPSILHAFQHRYPGVTVTPFAMPYPEHVPALRAGTIDIAWTLAVPDPDIVSQSAVSDKLLVALPADHPQVHRKRIDIGTFTDEKLIVLSRSTAPRLYDDIIDLCSSRGFRPTVIREVNEEVTVLGFVAAGFGVALAPFPWSTIHIPGLVFRDLTPSESVYESLSWHRDRNTPMIRSFVSTAMEIIAEKRPT